MLVVADLFDLITSNLWTFACNRASYLDDQQLHFRCVFAIKLLGLFSLLIHYQEILSFVMPFIIPTRHDVTTVQRMAQ